MPAAGAGAFVLLLLIVLRACTGGGGGNDAGSCMSDLLEHLPSSVDSVSGIDYTAARHHGFKSDGSLEDFGQSIVDTGVIPDPVTTTWRIKQLAGVDRFEAQTGVGVDDIVCSVGDEQLAVATGRFDAAKVKGSDAGASGRLAATDDLLAFTSGSPEPTALLEPAGDGGLANDEAFRAVVESLRDDGAYSIIVQRGDGTDKNHRAVVAGIGAADSDDDRTVVIAWMFPDEDSANESRPEVVESLNNLLRGTLSLRSSDLTVDGPMVTASIPTRTAPDLQAITNSGSRLVPEPD